MASVKDYTNRCVCTRLGVRVNVTPDRGTGWHTVVPWVQVFEIQTEARDNCGYATQFDKEEGRTKAVCLRTGKTN